MKVINKMIAIILLSGTGIGSVQAQDTTPQTWTLLISSILSVTGLKPDTDTVPSEGLKMPERIFMVVLLPAPLAPA